MGKKLTTFQESITGTINDKQKLFYDFTKPYKNYCFQISLLHPKHYSSLLCRRYLGIKSDELLFMTLTIKFSKVLNILPITLYRNNNTKNILKQSSISI